MMAVARSFCDIFLAMRACMMSFFVSVDTLACVRVSVSFSRRDIWAECAERLPPAPYFFIVSVGRPAALAAAPDMRDVFVLFLLIFCSLCGNGIKTGAVSGAERGQDMFCGSEGALGMAHAC